MNPREVWVVLVDRKDSVPRPFEPEDVENSPNLYPYIGVGTGISSKPPKKFGWHLKWSASKSTEVFPFGKFVYLPYGAVTVIPTSELGRLGTLRRKAKSLFGKKSPLLKKAC